MSENDASIAATRDTYDHVAEEYAARIGDELDGKPLDRALLAAFAEQVDGLGLVADLGCGPGHVTAYLADLGVDAMGIDLSPEMVAVARRRYPSIAFAQGSMLALDAPDASWGGIVAFYSIIHLPPETRPTAFAEFYRALRPGGRALLAFHIGEGSDHLDDWWGQSVSLDIHFLQPDAIATQLEEAGFTLEARLIRQPYAPDVEHQSQRAYLLAYKPEA